MRPSSFLPLDTLKCVLFYGVVNDLGTPTEILTKWDISARNYGLIRPWVFLCVPAGVVDRVDRHGAVVAPSGHTSLYSSSNASIESHRLFYVHVV